jgi:hypothetical protein
MLDRLYTECVRVLGCPGIVALARQGAAVLGYAIDSNGIEVKRLYVDFRVPQIPLGNRVRLGSLPIIVTLLHSLVLYLCSTARILGAEMYVCPSATGHSSDSAARLWQCGARGGWS